MQSLVISLKTATERRQHIETQFGQQNIQYKFFDALTPDLAAPLAKEMQLNVNAEFLSAGELACFMSHVSIWQKMVDENIPYLAIFEDDVYLGEQATVLLNEDQWIQQDWNIIKLEAFADKVFLSQKSIDIAEGQRQIYQLKGKNLGTAGYVLSLQGAKAYLKYIQSVQLIALDQLMFNDYIRQGQLQVHQMNPALCIQEMMLYPETKTVLSSDLLAERKQRMKKYKKKGWAKIQVELLRIFKQVSMALLGKAVPFR